jgi:hypothetical protein
VKLDELVFRADQIVDRGTEIVVTARTNDDVSYRLEAMRDQMHARRRVKFVYGDRVAEADVSSVERNIRFGGAADVELTLARATRMQPTSWSRVSTGGLTPDDLVELGLKELFFGAAPPKQDVHLMGLTRTGIDEQDLAQAFTLPNEIVVPITRLVVATGLISSGNAARVLDLQAGPAIAGNRNLRLRWEPPADYAGTATPREIEGIWSAR